MKKISLLLLQLFCAVILNAQTEGRVFDRESSTALTGAHVILYDAENTILYQTITDRSGRFSVPVPAKEGMKLVISFVGYQVNEVSFTTGSTAGQMEIGLAQKMLPVGEVVVSAMRQEKYLKDISLPMVVVNSRDIERSPRVTLADIVKSEPGLYIARDGIWATSLNVRGLSEQRIVTLVDGNRVETATDIAAGLATIDVNDIERVEVIKGAASSLYGSGALGGVVNIITRDGAYNQEFYAKGTASLSFQSVNSMHTENASLVLGDEKWYVRLSGTIRDAANVNTPAGELENSQFSDNNLSLKASVKPFQNHELKLNLQRYRVNNAGIPGGKAFPGSAKATYTDAGRDMIGADYRILTNGEVVKELNFKYFYQYIPREVELIPNPNTTITPSGYHTTHGGTFQARLKAFEGHSTVTGIDLWSRNLRTERYKDVYQPVKDSAGNLIRTNHIFRAEIPIPETDFTSGGLFIQDNFKPFERLSVNIGGRVDLIRIRNEEAVDPWYLIVNDVRNDNPANQRVTFEAGEVLNHSWSADLGLLYSFTNDLDGSLTLSRAFRSPSIEERFKYIDLGSIVSIGNPELEPENGYFADLGLKLWKEKLQASINLFANSMNNLIVEEPGEIEYTYIDQPNRVDTIPALIYGNVDKALLYGYDLSFSYSPVGRLVLSASSSFVRGRDTRNDTNLPLMPPLNGRLGLRYQSLQGYGIEAVCSMTADQSRIAEGEIATKGFAAYDLKFHTKTFRLNFASLKIYGGIENIFDRAYVNHLSTNRGFIRYEPGRNFYLRLGLEF